MAVPVGRGQHAGMGLRISTRALVGLSLALLVGACGSPEPSPTRLTLRTLSDSGVTGSVTLSAIGSARTLVSVEVDPAGHPDMPAHIHPGTCDELVPQPRYPLTNVVDGRSVTEVSAPLQELLAGDVALNLHASNAEMEIYTACVELR
ncbi:MAG TPA: hypothetical protein VH859_03165 [Candidatus Limnocylindria bacterium]|jgi:hypothetical protein